MLNYKHSFVQIPSFGVPILIKFLFPRYHQFRIWGVGALLAGTALCVTARGVGGLLEIQGPSRSAMPLD